MVKTTVSFGILVINVQAVVAVMAGDTEAVAVEVDCTGVAAVDTATAAVAEEVVDVVDDTEVESADKGGAQWLD